MVAAGRTPPASSAADDLLVAPLVIDLREAGSAPLELVGGKALNLGKLLMAGFPVPPGFCLTTEAYDRAVPAGVAELASRLDAVPEATPPPPASRGQDPPEGSIPEASAQPIRDLVVASAVPAGVEAALRAAYDELGGATGEEPVVAVRSSAAEEDLPFASFAGQQDAYLGVVGQMPYLTLSGDAGRPSGATGRWPTGRRTASAIPARGSPSSSSGR